MSLSINTLSLEWFTTTVRLGGREEVDSLGFVIDGQPLLDWLRWTEPDVPPLSDRVSCLSRCFPAAEVSASLKGLLGRTPSSLPQGQPLYLCPCGDPQCGSLVVQIERKREVIQWARFTLVGVGAPVVLVNMPVLQFERDQYTTAMNASLALT